ncbi:MAG: NAD(P)/FAD-dependent oxidoreductase [Candidatus Abyssobacteria bacterium SURF_17]|uniref:NAD(P)/FAD-dependent oxidoreductase n=1 Tax=Candidatus Abyssobacteria bacterium SURF_17 TaxID=2093361 RepID=A0A419EX67_9BACT|nr:MAG: NAD(P)/FAD-dependent oxidoreductase [Candidatus Abyssubacteria bacterium SURF_17]
MRGNVIIIGGGFGGLSAGALLSKSGIPVTLFESDTVLGGRAKCIEKEGYIVDLGLHANRFGDDGPAARVLKMVGQAITFAHKKDRTSYVYQDGKLIKRPNAIEDFLQTELVPEESRQALLQTVFAMVAEDPADWYEKALLQFVEQHTQDEHVKRFFRLLGFTIIAPDIETASAGEVISFIKNAQMAKEPLAEPVGGAKQIIDKLESVIRSTGGEIKTGTRVERIELQDGKAIGVTAGGRLYTASAIVFTPPIQHLFQFIKKDYFSPDFVSYAENLEPTSGVSIDFGLRKPVADMEGNIICLDPVVLGSFPSNYDSTLAPAGKQLSTWLMVVPYAEAKKGPTLKNALDSLRDFIRNLYPTFFDNVEWERPLAYLILDGVHLKVGQTRKDRHSIQSPHVRNLFFVGDTAQGDGCSGDIAFDSATKAAPMIQDYLATARNQL